MSIFNFEYLQFKIYFGAIFSLYCCWNKNKQLFVLFLTQFDLLMLLRAKKFISYEFFKIR